MSDFTAVLNSSWSPQAKIVVLFCITSLFQQVWRARNLRRYENLHWKACSTTILANAKLVGNAIARCSNSSISKFTFLRGFDISIHPRKPLRTLEVLWTPPPRGWIKGNIDGLTRGSPSMTACGRIFKDDGACQITSFSAYLGPENFEFAELMSAIIAIERTYKLGWKKVWIETNCLLVVKALSNSNLVFWKVKSRWLSCQKDTLPINFMIFHIYPINFMIFHIYRKTNFYADKLFAWYNYVHINIVRKCVTKKKNC